MTYRTCLSPLADALAAFDPFAQTVTEFRPAKLYPLAWWFELPLRCDGPQTEVL